jgi:AcrR family transcriptional regulator
MELHQEVGPARTTIAEIARRAGVQRLTVYNHFPDEQELFGACQAHWLRLHPPPDLTEALALPDPVQRIDAVLRRYYGWYRETESMSENVQRDRGAVAPLNEVLEQTADTGLGHLADALAAGFKARGRVPASRRALIGLALDSGHGDAWTGKGSTTVPPLRSWRKLSRAPRQVIDSVQTAGTCR